jgi:L-amino acid N-acyltransferase YncA
MLGIRPYLQADLLPLMAIMNQVIAPGDAFVYEGPFDDMQMFHWLNSYPHKFVAKDEQRIVGAYFLRPNFPGRGAHVCNAAYMVAEDARGLGVGKLMGEHSIATAQKLGYAAMQFNAVVSTNDPAVALWRSLGFQTIGTSPQAFRNAGGELVDLYIMHRVLLTRPA